MFWVLNLIYPQLDDGNGVELSLVNFDDVRYDQQLSLQRFSLSCCSQILVFSCCCVKNQILPHNSVAMYSFQKQSIWLNVLILLGFLGFLAPYQELMLYITEVMLSHNSMFADFRYNFGKCPFASDLFVLLQFIYFSRPSLLMVEREGQSCLLKIAINDKCSLYQYC